MSLNLPPNDDDKLSDIVGSANASRQPSVRPSAPVSEDEIMSEQSESEPEEEEEDEQETKSPKSQKPPTEAQLRREAARAEKANQKKAAKDQKNARNDKLNERRAGVDNKKMADSIKRFSYLLGQTDLFSHFCDLKKERDPEFARLLAEAEGVASDKKTRKGAKAKDNRRRKTEKEEDAELLQGEDDEAEEDAPFVFTESPVFVKGGQMRDYQVQGLNWMVSLNHNGINGILADEMGLGKTLQTVSFLGYLKFIRNITGPHLIIVPKSTLDNWSREVAHWVPGFNMVMLRGTKEERASLIQESILTQSFDICITSYEICQREKSSLKKISWEYIIIDEAHRIKNVDSLLSQIVRLFNCRQRLLITGTPLQNNLQELWALLNFLLPDVFSNSEDFDKWFQSKGEDQDSDQVVQQLHKVLRPFLLRRVKADVEKSLLPKKEINVYVGMTEMQRKWYRSILEKDIDAVNGASGKKEGKTRLLNIVMQLRKCCNHPYLFDGAEPGPPYTTDEHLVDNSGKMVVLDKLLKNMKAKGSRVLIFSQMSRVLDILEDYCQFREFEYCRLDGQTAHEDRMAAIDAYNKPDSEKFVFLLTTRAGGLGINLTTADIVVLFDSDWNPQADLQAMDRAHRIGQKKQVYVFRFVTENAVEEKVLERAAQKLRLDQLVIQQGRATPANKNQSKDDILDMIQHGAEKIINSKEDMSVTADIEDIIKRGEERTQQLNEKYSSLNIHDLANFASEVGATTAWEGEEFGKRKTIGNLWIEPSKRERRGANYDVDGYYRETMSTGARKGPLPKGIVKAPTTGVKRYDFQFFPPRLYALVDKELAHFRKSQDYVVPLVETGTKTAEEREEERRAAQEVIDNAEPLTEEEEEEKTALLSEGFEDWQKRHYQAFIRGCEASGKTDYEGIQKEIPDKTVEEVESYGKVFWQRYKEIEDWERQMKKIEDAEARRDKDRYIERLLKDKVESTRHPFQSLTVAYANQTKGKTYTEEEDRFLLVQLNKYGLTSEGVYDKIKKDISNWPAFRFDWFIKSRTPIELQRRCTTLISLVQKEADEKDKGKGKAAVKKESTPVASTSTNGKKRKSAASETSETAPSKAKKSRK